MASATTLGYIGYGKAFSSISCDSIEERVSGGGVTIKNHVANVVALNLNAGAVTLTTQDSGKTFLLDNDVAQAIQLPVAAVGLKYKFVVANEGTTDGTIVPEQTLPDTFEGNFIGAGLGTVANADSAQILIDASVLLLGDYVEIECYATGEWSTFGISQVAAGFVAS